MVISFLEHYWWEESRCKGAALAWAHLGLGLSRYLRSANMMAVLWIWHPNSWLTCCVLFTIDFPGLIFTLSPLLIAPRKHCRSITWPSWGSWASYEESSWRGSQRRTQWGRFFLLPQVCLLLYYECLQNWVQLAWQVWEGWLRILDCFELPLNYTDKCNQGSQWQQLWTNLSTLW